MSEPSSKIIKLDSFSGSLHQAEMEGEEIQFFIILCNDVFLEVLRWGNRRQLVKLERVGMRFHWNVERWFSKTPFLRLDFIIRPSHSGHGLEVEVSDSDIADCNKKYSDFSTISFADSGAFPSFLRLGSLSIELSVPWGEDGAKKAWDTQSIDVKCQLFEDKLKLIDPEILSDAKLCFVGVVDENDSSRFSDHSELLKYFSDRILPIYDKLRGYTVEILLVSDKSSANDVLTSLLQMPRITCCSDVYIVFHDVDQMMNLPVKEISNWLHRKRGCHRERSLQIFIIDIENLIEMLNHLKEAFEAAKSPTQPYTLTLEDIWDDEGLNLNQMEKQTIVNKITNEQFSVEKVEGNEIDDRFSTITIKRGMKTKKKT